VASQAISMITSSAPSVSIVPVSGRVDFNAILRLVALLQNAQGEYVNVAPGANLTVLWSCDSGNFDMEDPALRASPRDRLVIAFAAGAFRPSTTYRFSLTVTDTVTGDTVSAGHSFIYCTLETGFASLP